MQAFHGDPAVKEKYLTRVRKHREADDLIRGVGWENGRGCAVGCTLEAYDHSLYPIELGIPEWLARVEDDFFEGVPEKSALVWPELFLSSIRPGANLESTKAPFLVFVLNSTLSNFDHEKFPQVKAAVEGSIAYWSLPAAERSEAARSAAESAAWSAAESAAWSAAWSAARSAAKSAAWSAAESAAKSAAWSAAESAAESAAWSAAWSAAKSAAYEKFAEKLIELLKQA